MGNQARDLTPYSPRLLLEWEGAAPEVRHRAIDGTLVFADVSGFTRLSERLSQISGKAGAEEMTDIIGALFGDLLTVAARRGGEMLKYGGDAVLVFFRGEDHVVRAAAGACEMQSRLGEIGRVEAAGRPVRLRMSVGVHTGTFDLFKVGERHRELVIAGPATTETVRMEAAASAGQILLSEATADALPGSCLGARTEVGRLLRRAPAAPTAAIAAVPDTSVAGQLVDPDLAAHLPGDPDHRLATIGFVHVLGVDDVLRQRGGQVAAERIAGTVAVLQASFATFGVTFLATDLASDGTKVIAASGVPTATEDAERRMCLALRRVLDEGTPLPIRAGVHRGHLFAATVGPAFRKTYTVIGDVVNTAARLCARAEPGEVLALADVVQPLRGAFATTPLPPFVAKGKALPLEPLRLDALAEDATETTVEQLPMVGRDAELSRMRSLVERAAHGEGSFVELVADLGAGKTRLVTEVLAGLTQPVHVVHCEPYEQSTPFHPLKRLLARALFGEDTPSDVPSALASAVADVAPGQLRWLPLIGAVLDVEMEPTPDTTELDSRFRLQRTAIATAEVLTAALREPTVIVVEDTHWIDEASAAVLRHLESIVSRTPWLVCTTRRNEAAAFVASSARTTTITLEPLDDATAGALVAGNGRVPPHVRDALVARAAGNPLFLTSLLAADRDGLLPDRLEAAVATQIDRLDPDSRKLLRRASVLGSRFSIELLAAVADDAMAPSPSAVCERVQHLLVPDAEGHVRFRHQLVRDVAYEALPYRERRLLHARAGAALEADPRARTEAAAVLSMHFLEAGDHARAWQHASAAAARARAMFANVEAAALLERALAASRALPDLPTGEVAATWAYLGECHMFLGQLKDAKTAFRRARRLHREDRVRVAKLCHLEARIAQREGRTGAIAQWVRRGLRTLDPPTDAEERAIRAELLVLQAWMKENTGKPKEAQRWATRALGEAELAGNQRVVAYSFMVLDGVDVALGRPEDPTRAKRALEIYEELGMLEDTGVMLNNLGTHSYLKGRWTEALHMYERAADALARIGDLQRACYGELNIAEILIDQGRCDEALARIDAVEEQWRSLGEVAGLAFAANHRARVHVHRGDAAGALALFAEARPVFERFGLAPYVLELDARVADALLRCGEIERARAAVDVAIATDRAAGGSRLMPMLQRTLAYCCAAVGDAEGAWAALDASLHAARSAGSAYDVAMALEGFASLADPSSARTAPAEVEVELAALLSELDIVSTPPPPLRTPAVAAS